MGLIMRTLTDFLRAAGRAGNYVALPVLMLIVCRGYGAETSKENRVEQWRIIQIPLESKKFKEDPPLDLTLDVTFSKDDESIKRPAFWDGGANWKVRFSPTQTGVWKYKTVCSDPGDRGLHDQVGSVTCEPNQGGNANFKHGFLKVSADQRRLAHADGTRFFWLGDTHWGGPDNERVDTCNHPEHKGGACPHGGQFQHLVQDRKAKGFTVYQLYPNVTRDYYWKEKNVRLNPQRFNRVLDVMMNYLAEQGFVVALGLGHWKAPSLMPDTALKRWTRYLVARYGAHPIVWITSQESDMKPKEAKGWLAVAKEIHRMDGHKHPLSYHQRWGPHTTWWKEAWHDWGCTQGGHRNVKLRSKKDYGTFWNFTPPKPWMEGEHMYEGLRVCGGPHSALDVRKAAWKSQLCGSFGYTYGGAGVWLPGWDAAAVKKSTWIDLVWHQGMNLPGSTQMAHFKTFFTSLDDWDRFVPRFNAPKWGEWAQAEQAVLATVENKTFVVYFYGENTALARLKNLQIGKRYSAQWFDPRTGTYSSISESFASTDGTWPVPQRPTRTDWVLLVRLKPTPENTKQAARP